MSRAQQNLCFSLTSQSYSYVPVCETEKSCYAAVESIFKTDLGYLHESKLYEVKNHTARSWFFFNKAVKEIKSLQGVCAQKNPASLGGEINQAKFFMDSAFLEIDLAMKKSFDLVSSQETMLSGEKIDLVKEEPIYNSLVQLRQIVLELNSGPTNSDSYVSYYMNKAKAFLDSSFSKTGLDLVESTPFWLEKTEYYGGTILYELGGDSVSYFPFFGNIYENVLDYLNFLFFSRQNLSALENFPASEFMKLYSDLGGINNSALRRFADLENGISSDLVSSKKRADLLWIEIDEKKVSCLSLIEESNSFPEFEDLADLLVVSKVEISDLNSPADCFSKSIAELREKKNSNSLPFGQELFELKSINSALDLKLDNLSFKNNIFTDLLGSACDKKADEIKAVSYDGTSVQLKSLLDNSCFFSSKTLSSKDFEKFSYCEAMVENYSLFEAGLKDYSFLESKMKDSAKDCISYLDIVFKYAKLSELNAVFDELKFSEVTKDNIALFNSSCESIKSQVENELRSEEWVSKLETSFNGLVLSLKSLEKLSAYYQNSALDAKIGQITEKTTSYEEYFAGGKVLFDRVLPVRDLLLEKISESEKGAAVFLNEKIIEYAKTGLTVSRIESVPVDPAFDQNFYAKIFIPNPISGISDLFSIDVNFKILGLLNKNPCVDDVSGNESSVLVLSCLPLGGIFIDAQLSESVSFFESDSFVSVSNEESVLKRIIKIGLSSMVKKLSIKTTIPRGADKWVVLISGREIVSYSDNGVLGFVAENVSNKTEAVIYFYIDGVISSSLNFVESKDSLGGEVLYYDLRLFNSAPQNLSAMIAILLPKTSSHKEIVLFDSSYSKISFSEIDGRLILKNVEFLAGESKKYFLRIAVNSSAEYYESALNAQIGLLNSHELFEQAEKTKGVLENLSNSSAAALAALWEKNNNLIILAEAKEESENRRASLLSVLENEIEKLRELGQNLNLAELSTEAEGVLHFLDSFSDLNSLSEKEINSSLEKISKFSFDVNKKLSNLAGSLSDSAQNISYSHKSDLLLEKLSDLLEYKAIFDQELPLDPLSALQTLSKIKKGVDDMNSLALQMDFEEKVSGEVYQKRVETLFEECVNLLGWLNGELLDRESDLINAKFVSPITQSRLKKLSLLIPEIKNSDLNVGEKIARLSEIKQELVNASDFVKRQSVAKFNSGIDNKLDDSILLESRELIDSNRFVDAYLLLSSANKNGGLVEFPFESFLPIMAVIVVALVLKGVVKKRKSVEGEKKKVILREWDGN